MSCGNGSEFHRRASPGTNRAIKLCIYNFSIHPEEHRSPFSCKYQKTKDKALKQLKVYIRNNQRLNRVLDILRWWVRSNIPQRGRTSNLAGARRRWETKRSANRPSHDLFFKAKKREPSAFGIEFRVIFVDIGIKLYIFELYQRTCKYYKHIRT